MRSEDIGKLFSQSFQHWYRDQPFQMAAALAYYTLFSLAPLLLILISIVGLFSGATEAQSYIVGGLADLLGIQSTETIQEMLRNAQLEERSGIAAVLGVILLLFGAGGVLAQFQYSLNRIWSVETAPKSGWWPVIKARFLSYAMLLVVGFLLLVSLVVTTVLSAVTRAVGELIPFAAATWWLVDIAVSLAFMTTLFALIYKVLPDVRVTWTDVWIGAALTALLFSIGKSVIGLYLGGSGAASAYGAAGSLVTVLLWVYYSALVVFFGAQVSRVYAIEYGKGIRPTENAVKTPRSRSRSAA